MKKLASTLILALVVTASLACSNWNRATPAALDNKTIQAEVEKNIARDGLTGVVHVDNVTEGIVTLTGTVKSSSDRSKAYDDATKVPGVKGVRNDIKVGS